MNRSRRSSFRSSPKPAPEALEVSAPDFSPDPMTTGALREALALWVPFDLEIGRLSGTGSLLSDEAERSGQEERIERRRAYLEKLLHEADAGGEEARRVVEALEVVMRLFAVQVERVVQTGANSSDSNAELELKHEGKSPGQVALHQLESDTTFLRAANFYGLALNAWLLHALEQCEVGEIPSAARPAKKKRSERGRRSSAPVEDELGEELTTSQKFSARVQPLAGLMHFKNDAVHCAAVRALAQSQSWVPSGDFAYAFHHSHAGAQVTMGLPSGERADTLWHYLVKGGPRMIKGHYALWARYYEDCEQSGMRYVTVAMNQFCSDLGYTRHQKGGFRREHKQEAQRLFVALTSIELSVTTTIRGRDRRLKGPLWQRGFEAEERDQYSDIFGAMRVGDPDSWEPVAFSFAPGPWFADPQWRAYHRFIGRISSGLLKLSGNTDQWPILIGGYLGTLGRINRYNSLRLRVGTILKNLDLAQTSDAQRRVSQYREKLERALDRLAEPEIGVILSWRFDETPTTALEEPDMDDAEEVAAYGAQATYPPGDWRNWKVVIEMPLPEERARLERQRAQAISRGEKRKASPRRKKRVDSKELSEGKSENS